MSKGAATLRYTLFSYQAQERRASRKLLPTPFAAFAPPAPGGNRFPLLGLSQLSLTSHSAPTCPPKPPALLQSLPCAIFSPPIPRAVALPTVVRPLSLRSTLANTETQRGIKRGRSQLRRGTTPACSPR